MCIYVLHKCIYYTHLCMTYVVIHICIHTQSHDIYMYTRTTHTVDAAASSQGGEIQEDCFAEYSLFYRALLQKRPIILRSLLIVATWSRAPITCCYQVATVGVGSLNLSVFLAHES